MGPGELVDFPESPLSSLVMVQSHMQEVRQCQQETCVDEQGSCDRSQI